MTFRYRTEGSHYLSSACFPESPESNLQKVKDDANAKMKKVGGNGGGRRLSMLGYPYYSDGEGDKQEELERELQSYLDDEEGFA